MAELATIARPYAEALLQLAQERSEQTSWQDALDVLLAVTQSEEFKLTALSPKVKTDQLVDALFSCVTEKGIKVSPDWLRKFLMQLVLYRRLDALPEISIHYQELCDAAQNVAEVCIRTAYPLTDEQLNEILPLLEKRFGKQLKPHVLIDESLIAGICAVVGDDTLDMSVKARLETMKQALIA